MPVLGSARLAQRQLARSLRARGTLGHGSDEVEESPGEPRPAIRPSTAQGPGDRATLDVWLSMRLLSRPHVLWPLRRPIHRAPTGRRARGLLETARSQGLRAHAGAA